MGQHLDLWRLAWVYLAVLEMIWEALIIGFDLDNLVASVVLVAMIVSGNGVNCFSGF